MDLFRKDNHINDYDECVSTLLGTRSANPFVSIMIPTFRRPDFLKKAIRSALSQVTEYDYEVVVVDNDQNIMMCEDLLSEFHDDKLCFYTNSKNIGMFGNWNRCIELANGEWITILSDDDELDELFIDEMMHICSMLPNCGAIACSNIRIDDEGNTVSGTENRGTVTKIEMKDFYFLHPANIYGCLFNKEMAIGIGGFNDKFYPCSDAEFLLKICYYSSLYLLNIPLFKYRWAVNESVKIETQFSFMQFNNFKAEQINRNTIHFPKIIDRYMRNCMIDMQLDIVRNRGINVNSNQINSFKKELGLSSYHLFNAYFYRIIIKVYLFFFKKRKAI